MTILYVDKGRWVQAAAAMAGEGCCCQPAAMRSFKAASAEGAAALGLAACIRSSLRHGGLALLRQQLGIVVLSWQQQQPRCRHLASYWRHPHLTSPAGAAPNPPSLSGPPGHHSAAQQIKTPISSPPTAPQPVPLPFP